MATSFSANQYENAFKSNKLSNWEKPSNYREDPRPMDGYTKIIANDRGHVIDGVQKSKGNPWGNFVGTWDLPKQIPGNTASVPTARTTYAQEKLKKEYDEANKVLGGSMKNVTRHDIREGRGRSPKPSTQIRSGAEAPGSKMFPETCSPAADPHRQYTPLGSFPQNSVVTPTQMRTPSPQQIDMRSSPQITSPIPVVPDMPEVLAQGSREPTPEVQQPIQGLAAL